LLQKENLQLKVFVCQNAVSWPFGGKRLPDFGLSHPEEVEKVPCLGKIDPRYLLKAFEGGCDAVCVIGCAIGKCKTMDGNLRAQKRVGFVRGILEEIGMRGERLFLYLREPLDEQRARELVGEFLSASRALGPSELKTHKGAERA
jgi:coenzyme F420-reducing hydrogenase delta subunit